MFLILPHTGSTYKVPILFFSLPLVIPCAHTVSLSYQWQDAASDKSTAVFFHLFRSRA